MRNIRSQDVAFIFLCAGVCLAVAGGATATGEDHSTGKTAGPSGGTVEGVIVYQADHSRPWRYERYYVKDRKTGELAEAVVSLTASVSDRGGERRDPITAVIDQKDFQFAPETVAIRSGDRVKFTNSDAVVHNVSVFDSDNAFNVNMPSGGEHTQTFKTPGGIGRPIQVGCVYHSAMRAWIYVFDHPHFQVTRPDGRFRLNNVPPGDYTVEVVHPAGKLRWHQEIKVEPSKSVKLQIELSPENVVKSIRSRKSENTPTEPSPAKETK